MTTAHVLAFHDAREPGKYHSCINCPEAAKIPDPYRRPGVGGGKPCEMCQRLILQGRC